MKEKNSPLFNGGVLHLDFSQNEIQLKITGKREIFRERRGVASHCLRHHSNASPLPD